MTGGLIQIVAYGTADIFLTGMPQITFFKLVYRRYTNFAIENIEQPFSGISNFGNKISYTLDKIGDLVNKMYLKIVIPSVNLPNPNYTSDYNSQELIEITNLNTQYSDYKSIINYIYQFYRELNNYIININQNVNVTNLYNKILQIANLYYSSNDYTIIKNKYSTTYNKKVFINDFIIETDYYDKYSQYLYQNLDFNNIRVSDLDIIKNVVNYKLSNFSTSVQLINTIKKELLDFKNNSIKIDNYFYSTLKNYKKINRDHPNYKFAWVSKLGHQIIKKISLEIGGQLIDRHTNDWYNIWNELSLNTEIQVVYNKMIGNIPNLTAYNNMPKDSYTLYIPLNFWFCKYIAGALPLVFLRYSDVRIELELNDIKKLIYTDAPTDYNFDDTIQLVDVSLLIDYIYLDVDERTKFAQSPQECLIEVVQNYDYININTNNLAIESYFINSVKEIYWVAQTNNNLANNFHDVYDLGIIYKIASINKVVTNTLEQKIILYIGNHVFNKGDTVEIFFSENYNNKYKIIDTDINNITLYSKFYKFESGCFMKSVNFITPSNSFGDTNPFINTTYTFEQFNRFQNYDSQYTNFIQPYQYHTRTPADGINSYSFALMPEEYQPSGAANLSTYKYKSFVFTLNSFMVNNIKNLNDTITIKTYALGYNLLSFKNGMAGLVFNI
jgi:hypothetical protein